MNYISPQDTIKTYAFAGILDGAIDNKTTTEDIIVDDGSVFAEDDLILIDSEFMRILDISNDTLTVERAVDSNIAAHADEAEIFLIEEEYIVKEAARIAGFLGGPLFPKYKVAITLKKTSIDTDNKVYESTYAIIKCPASIQSWNKVINSGFAYIEYSDFIVIPADGGGHWELMCERTSS